MKCSWLPIEIDMCCCQGHHTLQFGQIGRLENKPRYSLSDRELGSELSVRRRQLQRGLKHAAFVIEKFKKEIIFRHLVCFDSVVG